MLISEYKILSTNADDISPNAADTRCAYSSVDRAAKEAYLYNESAELLQILDLGDFGIVDKKKRIPHNGRYIEVADGARQYFSLSCATESICTWSEALGLALWRFDGEKLFSAAGAFCAAYFDERANALWAVRRDDNENVTLFLFDQSGNTLAQLKMQDHLYQSAFLFSPLPEENKIGILFGGGQDGSQYYFLSYDGGAITVDKTLPDDLTFLFASASGAEAFLVDFYEQTLYRCAYPALLELARFRFPTDEPWDMGAILPLTDSTLLVCNNYDMRFYLFDAASMQLGEELVVKGFEPYENKRGEIVSDIVSVRCERGHLIFDVAKRIGDEKQQLALVAESPF